ncbi:hypothetical protein [Comamonas fluminis]|uniref:hypothetical protein n=1 Tax=Comamonas fluminis TaxID=2796366 RepID=UPI001C44A594|nr:hypothetical protein [Comamonas fluminis]
MASHMGVQKIATERNSNVEYFVHYILEEFANYLKRTGGWSSFELGAQRQYSSEIASDVWDHCLVGTQRNGKKLELWCQTTCYKGNGTGTPEPNKTYEVRETLVEGISIRKYFSENAGADYRSIHFTVGDRRYTYQWFLDLKSAVYDKSVYIGDPGYDIFSDIAAALGSVFTEDEKSKSLSDCVKKNSILGAYIKKAIEELKDWWGDGECKKSNLADCQWSLVANEFNSNNGKWPDLAKVKGGNIKGRVNASIFEENSNETDPLIAKTAIKLLKKNPFLQSAIDITSNWERFCVEIREVASSTTDTRYFLETLWSTPLPKRLVIRRLLLRIHTNESVAYVQDRDIEGVTEHNIYSGDHSSIQASTICGQILSKLQTADILTVESVADRIIANGKRLINQARWFEAKNGTELKPSFDYVELSLLEAGYKVVNPTAASIRTIGYHSEISSENVRPYTNLKIVKDSTGKIVCFLKAKFFRIQEFPRRCKEQAFVGISLKYQLSNQTFIKRFSAPLIMYVDMAEDCVPPEYAIKRLMSFGWQVVFSVEDLIQRLSGKSV